MILPQYLGFHAMLYFIQSNFHPHIDSDRKTDIVFSVKDFIFSFEPSSWRFDVSESLNGYHQVVDFTVCL